MRANELLPLALAIAALGAGPARAAPGPLGTEGRGESAERSPPKDPKTALDVVTRPAGSPTLLTQSAAPYAEAKRLFARGQASAALQALGKAKGELFADREALLRGDALLALGDQKRAKVAYLEAIERSQLEEVSIAAARGLVSVLGLAKEHEEQLLYIDALLEKPSVSRKPNLLLQRAGVLADLGRAQDAADLTARIVRDFPGTRVSEQAAALLEKLRKQRGVKVPGTTPRVELVRIRNLVAAEDWRRAEAEMAKLEKAQPKLKSAIDLQRAEMFRRRRMRDDERAVLLQLYADRTLGPEDRGEVLFRLGRVALATDDGVSAQRWFDELARDHPADPSAVEGQYLASWVPYNTGDFDAASERMLRFAGEYRRSPNRAEALWFAGWSAYLAKKDGLARRALEQLLEEHPTSDLRSQARYWIGRLRQRAGELDQAKAAYREVLASQPLSYWGFWSITRLEELGEKVVLDAPPPTPVASVTEVISMLGPKRPTNVDRAIALHAAQLQNEALDELTAANAYLRSVRDTMGRTMVADLLHTLGAHFLAFRVGSSITQDGGDLVTGRPHAWRAWRHAYPRAFEKECTSASATHVLDIDLILSIMRTESSFRPAVRSPVGAYGLMQLMPGTAAQIGRSAKDAKGHAARYRTPESNVWLGTWYLKRLLERYGGQLAPAIGAYNAGPSPMDRWIGQFGGVELDEFVERVPYRETRRYIRRVLETYMVYRRLNGQPLPDLRTKVAPLAAPAGAVAF